MTTWFVSRHQGAIEWAKHQNFPVDRWISHLDTDMVMPGDTVIGTLPVHLAAMVCARNARFFFLSINLNAEQRGLELNMNEMQASGCVIQEYVIRSV